MASDSGCIYIGVTGDLPKRVWTHREKIDPRSFTARYNCHKLVYVERHETMEAAIRREKQIKRWRRDKKEWLIAQINPEWDDLAVDEWF